MLHTAGKVHTVVPGQAPPRGDAPHATGEVVSGLSQTHRGHTGTQLSGSGQLDQGDVIVDGPAIVAGVLEDLRERETAVQIFHGACGVEPS